MSETQTAKMTDSPWFWIHIFSVAALVALAVMGPKYAKRQSQIETSLQKRQHAAKLSSDSQQDPEATLVAESSESLASSDSDVTIRLTPFYFLLGGVAVVSWGVVWWRFVRGASKEANASADASSESADGVKSPEAEGQPPAEAE